MTNGCNRRVLSPGTKRKRNFVEVLKIFRGFVGTAQYGINLYGVSDNGSLIGYEILIEKSGNRSKATCWW